jgi:Flp pilus assembly protein TadD
MIAISIAAMLAGACSVGNQLGLAGAGAGSGISTSSATTGKNNGKAGQSQSELEKAVEYWGEQHKKNPTDLKAALSFARNLKAAGRKQEAMGVLQSASLLHGDSRELASEYGRLALDLGHVQVASNLLTMADDPAKPDWKVVSARGTVFAKQGKFAEAIPYYERALQLSPGQASVLNNLALAYTGNGQAAKGEQYLRMAQAKGQDPKVEHNLALVLGLQGKHAEAEQVARASLPAEAAGANASYMRQFVKAQPPEKKSAPAIRTAGDPQRPAGGGNAARVPAGSWSTVVTASNK